MDAKAEMRTYDWAISSGGILEWRQRLRFLATIAASAPAFFYDRWLRRRSPEYKFTVDELRPRPPDSKVFRDARREAEERQSPAVTCHGFRTWAFGYALAKVEGRADQIAPNWFYLAAQLHDALLMDPVVGHCFTLKSADAVEEVGRLVGADENDRLKLKNAVVDHLTPGISKANSTRSMAVYIQQGSMADLTGYGLKSLPEELVDEVFDKYPPGEVGREIRARWKGESAAVLHGRAHFLDRWTGLSHFIAKPSSEVRLWTLNQGARHEAVPRCSSPIALGSAASPGRFRVASSPCGWWGRARAGSE